MVAVVMIFRAVSISMNDRFQITVTILGQKLENYSSCKVWLEFLNLGCTHTHTADGIVFTRISLTYRRRRDIFVCPSSHEYALMLHAQQFFRIVCFVDRVFFTEYYQHQILLIIASLLRRISITLTFVMC